MMVQSKSGSGWKWPAIPPPRGALLHLIARWMGWPLVAIIDGEGGSYARRPYFDGAGHIFVKNLEGEWAQLLEGGEVQDPQKYWREQIKQWKPLNEVAWELFDPKE